MEKTWNGIKVPLHTVIGDPRLSAFANSMADIEDRVEPGYEKITEDNKVTKDKWYIPKKNGDGQ